ncbi:MAG: methyltransferase domain-containing protein [Ignavibacteriaceae bacterium]|jgi:ubiquinone/menaquinone biosynthesis C-methylase UbiE
MASYVHGYTVQEAKRLEDQSNTLDELIHHDSIWEPGNIILEAGCGTGAQTKIIALKNPLCKFVSIDISGESITKAKEAALLMGISNVTFNKSDIFKLPYEDEIFDHVFVCFVIEHLPDYKAAIIELKRVLKPKGSIIIVEGDHGSAYFSPESRDAYLAIQCQVELQRRNGGDANIGRKLYPILKEAGFDCIRNSPRMVYADESNPDLVEGFTRNTFTAMIEGVKKEAISENLIDATTFNKGISDLYKTAGAGGVFCYTFFKATGTKK